jgi:hypothetical protein
MPSEEPAISFHFTVADLDPASRSVKAGWENGDVLYLWFAPVTQAQPDLTLTYDGKDWKAGALRKGCELEAKGTFQVIYNGPDGLMASGSSTRAGYLFQNPKEGVTMDGKSTGDVFNSSLQAFCQNVTYQFADDELTATIDGWKLLTDFQITLTDIPKGEYALLCTSKGNYIAVQEGFLLGSSSVSASGQDAGHYAHGESTRAEAIFYYARTNGNEVSSTISLTLIPKKNGTYLYSNALTYSPGEKKLKPSGSLQAVKIPYSKFVRTPEAVDMGLSVKWGSFNIGATGPGEYGYYYCYGETEPKEDYYWATYKYCEGDYDQLNKYCSNEKYGFEEFTDKLTELEANDDVASVKLGGKWRMPTQSEWNDLLTKCTWSWTLQYGLSGYLVTSSKTGNSIFLPAAGYHASGYYFSGKGYYWSSTLYTESPYNAYYLYFSSEKQSIDKYYRYSGYSVRPVFGD